MTLASDVYTAWIKATICFEQEHAATIIKYNFKLGDLILVRNTTIKKSLNCKMHVRYLSPLIIISWNKSGAYIVSELDGSVFDCPIAAFQVIPYFACQHIKIPSLDKLIDISICRLHELKDLIAADPEDDSDDLTDEEDSPLDPPNGDKD